jgi:tRNA G10  N-methylase Trm11
MHRYLFVLGREWKLSAAELFSVFGEDYEFITPEILCKNFHEKIDDPEKLQNRLGGTIKLAEVFDKADSLKDVESKIIGYLNKISDEKCIFAISTYNMPSASKNFLKKLLKNAKNALRYKGKVRFLNKPGKNVRSVAVFEEKLHQKGTDILIFKKGNAFLLAKTVSVQNFKKYSIRDYDRPARDAKSGMLPPKLAQLMINLACSGKNEGTIYDPFCGSGTVLMEGMLMGYNVMGSDLSEKAIKDSEENIKWLTGKFDVDKSLLKGLFVKDATAIDSSDFNVPPDFVVTETYLGPPLSQIPPKNEIEKNFKEIEENVLGTLKRLREKVVVIAVPFYRSGGKKYFLSNLPEKAKKIGYKTDSLFKSEKRGSLLYFRKDQIVGREIFRLKAT